MTNEVKVPLWMLMRVSKHGPKAISEFRRMAEASRRFKEQIANIARASETIKQYAPVQENNK